MVKMTPSNARRLRVSLRGMSRAVGWFFWTALAVGSWGACASEEGDSTDGHTSWLDACTRDGDCGATLVCDCGVCTRVCDESADCSGLGSDAVCLDVDRHPSGTCTANSAATSGLCVPTCSSTNQCAQIGGSF